MRCLSTAPQPPYFVGSSYAGGYVAIDKACGSSTDFYNVQFYNQGSTNTYTDCGVRSFSVFMIVALDLTTLIQKLLWTDSMSVFQIHQATNIDLNKLVIGKPFDTSDVTNSGYLLPPLQSGGYWLGHPSFMQQAMLASCAAQARGSSWNAGVMVWKFKSVCVKSSLLEVWADWDWSRECKHGWLLWKANHSCLLLYPCETSTWCGISWSIATQVLPWISLYPYACCCSCFVPIVRHVTSFVGLISSVGVSAFLTIHPYDRWGVQMLWTCLKPDPNIEYRLILD